MKKLLERHLKIYLIDEYNTSKIYFKDITKENDNLCVKMYGHKEKLHTVLTFKMGKNIKCINRDYNSTQNMLSI
jgi:hypothetical protein